MDTAKLVARIEQDGECEGDGGSGSGEREAAVKSGKESNGRKFRRKHGREPSKDSDNRREQVVLGAKRDLLNDEVMNREKEERGIHRR